MRGPMGSGPVDGRASQPAARRLSAGSRWASGAHGRHGKAVDAGHGHRPPATAPPQGHSGRKLPAYQPVQGRTTLADGGQPGMRLSSGRQHRARASLAREPVAVIQQEVECAYPAASDGCWSSLLTLVLVACGGPAAAGRVRPARSIRRPRRWPASIPTTSRVCEAMLVMEAGLASGPGGQAPGRCPASPRPGAAVGPDRSGRVAPERPVPDAYAVADPGHRDHQPGPRGRGLPDHHPPRCRGRAT